MQVPLSLAEFNLWLAIMALILVITSELISPYSGRRNLLINKRRLRTVGFTITTLYLASMIIQILIEFKIISIYF